MEYLFCGNILKLLKYKITISSSKKPDEVFYAIDDNEKQSYIDKFPNCTVSPIDNIGYEWLDDMVFTQDEQNCGDVGLAIEMGQEEYKKYKIANDPINKAIDLAIQQRLNEI